MKVLVLHPGLQHSHQLALALEEAGELAAFWSGVPVYDSSDNAREFWSNVSSNLRIVSVPKIRRNHYVMFPVLRRFLSHRLFERVANSWGHRLDGIFDFFVAKKIKKIKPDMVICYENSAFHSFRAAREIGAVCVLDAASVHYLAGSNWIGKAENLEDRWINTRKKSEIELADAIITCSALAAETYHDAGVPTYKLYTVPLGTEINNCTAIKIPTPIVNFLYVGTVRALKGVDLMLDAFENLQQDGHSLTLTLIGGIAEAGLGNRIRSMNKVTLLPFIPQPSLFNEIAKYDCLILPSRFDSFGMVVPEAMSAGLPVIVSDRVGSKCIIEEHPEAGWIVQCEMKAIRAKMLDLIRQPDLLVSASMAARKAALDYSWPRYRERVVKALRDIYKLAEKK